MSLAWLIYVATPRAWNSGIVEGYTEAPRLERGLQTSGELFLIKVVFCLRRLPSLTSEAFSDYWLNQHGPMVRAYAPVINIRRYTQSHLISDANLQKAAEVRGCITAPFDGVAEVWWNSFDDLMAVAATKEGRAASRAMIEDEKTFIDLANSVHFYCEEHVVYAD